VPRDRFLMAGKAWRLIRAGEADPERFALITPNLRLNGYWFVAGNVRLDLASLNKVETLLWDVWGAGPKVETLLRKIFGIGDGSARAAAVAVDDDLTAEVYDLYDTAARVAGDDVVFEAARGLFAGNAGLRTPETVLSLATYNGPRDVTLRG
jgi:hypothetical protein